MKQSKKIILSLAGILPLAIPVTVISCEYTEKRKLITDKIDELLNTKIDNDIASQTISDAIQRVRENNVGSLDNEVLQNGLQELEESAKVANAIANAINNELNPLIKESTDLLENLKNEDFKKYKKYIETKLKAIKQSIVEGFNKVNKLLNEKSGAFGEAASLVKKTKSEIANKIAEVKTLNKTLIQLHEEYEKIPNLLQKLNDNPTNYQNVREQYQITYKFAKNFLENSTEYNIEIATYIYESLKKYGELIK